MSPALASEFFTTSATWEAREGMYVCVDRFCVLEFSIEWKLSLFLNKLKVNRHILHYYHRLDKTMDKII